MFCPSNDTLSNITEKTKLLAQKCTQQIRVQHQQSCMSPGKKTSANNNSAATTPLSSSITTTVFNSKDSLINKDDVNCAKNNVKPNFKCFCPCKGTLSLRALAKKSFSKETGTTRWYVKVKHHCYVLK